MTRMRFVTPVLFGMAAIILSSPANAQHAGHMPGMNMPGMSMPGMSMPAAKKPAKKATAKMTASKKKTAKASGRAASSSASGKAGASKSNKPTSSARSSKAAKARPARTRAGHDMSTMTGHDMSSMPGHDMSSMPMSPTVGADPHAGHDMSTMPTGTMSGQDMGGMPSDTMQDHDMSSMSPASSGTDLPAGDAAAPPAPTDSAADAIYGAQAMAMGRHHLMQFHGGQKLGQVLFNVAEVQIRKGREAFEWDGEGWYGGDINRLWIKSQGEGEFGGPLERAEVQALYSRAIGPYFNLQGGIRYDVKPNPSRAYATLGIEGLAPSFFDLEGALFLSNKGEVLARAQGSYDQRITQRLILQPRAELNFAAQNSRSIGVGAGLSDAELGLRLRYDIRREFAPYVGIQYRRAFGRTRDYLRTEGRDVGGWSLLTGVRLWF